MSLTAIKVGSSTIFKPTHQTCSDAPQKPRYVYVQRSTALPSAWSGGETWVEFELPQTLGVVSRAIVRFSVSASASAVAVPTPYWVSRVETALGNDILETAYATDIYNEVVGFQSPQEIDNLNEVLNLTYPASSNGTIASGASTYYLPLDACVLKSMRPFIKGFNSKFRIRLYFPSTIQISGGTITLQDCVLIC